MSYYYWAKRLIKVHYGACYGYCTIADLVIYDNLLVSYQAIYAGIRRDANEPQKTIMHYFYLDPDEYIDLINQLINMKFFNDTVIKNEYVEPTYDAQRVSVTVYSDLRAKEVTISMGSKEVPTALTNLVNNIDKIIEKYVGIWKRGFFIPALGMQYYI